MNAAERSAAITRERTVAEMVAHALSAEPYLVKPEHAEKAQALLCRIYGHARKLAPPKPSPGGRDAA